MVSREVVLHVARLARIALSQEEVETYTRQLGGILEHVARIRALDLSGVPPTSHPLRLGNVLREDLPREGLPKEKALSTAPEREGDYFRVPRVVEE